MRRLHRTWLILAAAVALLLVVAVLAYAAVSAGDVQRKLLAKLGSKWDVKNLSLSVIPYASQARTDKGQFAEISVKADAAERRDKHIRIVDVYISARDVALDLNALWRHNEVKILSRRLGNCHVRLLEADVNKLLALKKTPIENLRASFANGQVTFTGKYRFNVKLVGNVSIHNGYEIWFEPTQASIGVVGIPVGIVKQFLKRLNPIIDMSEVPLQPHLRSIQVSNHVIMVTG